MAEQVQIMSFIYRAIGLDKLNQGTQQVNRASGALVGTQMQMNSAMAGLALRFVGYNLVLNTVMGAQQKLMQLVTDSISKFREFETRLAEVSTILQDDVDQMARFKVGIENLAVAYGQSTSDISKGLYDILSAAFAAEDAMNLLNTSIRASIAGLSDVRTAVQIFTTVLNAYGMSAEQATHVSDVLFQAVVRGKFQFAELESALGFVVPIAAQAGISIEELTAALSTATRHGLHLDMTARGLALAIQNIINPSEGAAKAARKYGIEMNGLAIRVLGLKGWFDELKKATDTYGKGVIGELIPNMRSVRVAMVLAGEEGAKGFAEDLAYLENISGRTDEALQKMMETSQFLANQLEQELEVKLRNIGDAWDEHALNILASSVQLADTWQYYLVPAAGALFLAYDKILQLGDKFREFSMKARFPETDVATEQVKQYLEAIKERERLSKQMSQWDTSVEGGELFYEGAEKDLAILDDIITNLEPAFNAMKGGIDTAQRELGDLEIVFDEVILDIQRLNAELSDPTAYGTYGQSIAGTLNLQLAQLEATKNQADAQHDIKMGLVDSTYQWVTNNEEVENAVKIIREHEEAQKKDRLESNLMSAALKELQIDMLGIQLKGMMRRRGLTRSEERQMKRLQIAQAKLRLENMNNQEKETKVTITAYNTAQDVIDAFLRKLEEESYQLKYTYNQQLTDLNNLIESEHTALEVRKDWWELKNWEIGDSVQELIDRVKVTLSDPGLAYAWALAFPDIDLSEILKSAEERQKEVEEGVGTYIPHYAPPAEPGDWVSPELPPVKPDGGEWAHPIWKYQKGIDYVPYDQMAFLHQGERVVPANENTANNFGGNNINITVNASVAKDYDVDRLAYQLGRAMQSNLMDARTGKSKYRSR